MKLWLRGERRSGIQSVFARMKVIATEVLRSDLLRIMSCFFCISLSRRLALRFPSSRLESMTGRRSSVGRAADS